MIGAKLNTMASYVESSTQQEKKTHEIAKGIY